jgi:protein involved in polysaccharide export with SLBB domain
MPSRTRRERIQLGLLFAMAAMAAAMWFHAAAWGQQIGDTTQPKSPADLTGANTEGVNSDGTDEDSPRREARNRLAVQTVLTADSLIRLMRAKPEVALEIKQLLAEHLQQEGFSTQDNAITDEQLFEYIASNERFREKLTSWLRARGYVSETEFQKMEKEPIAGIPLSKQTMRDLETQPDSSGLNAVPEQGSNAGLDTQTDEDAIELFGQQNSPSLSMPGARAFPLDNQNAATSNPAAGDLTSGQSGNARTAIRPEQLQQENRSRGEEERQEEKKQEEEEANRQPEILHLPAPYNLLALHDLYTQVPVQEQQLKRFGSDVFIHRGLQSLESPIDTPIGPEYVLGPGDGLSIDIWGSGSQTIARVVDEVGKVTLPEAGPLMVAGLTLEQAQTAIEQALAKQFRDAHALVTLARLRTVRIYVVGDVQRPGAYDISSLSTPLNALYAAGGPTSTGSLRILRQFRGNKMIGEMDLYDFLLHGLHSSVDRLEPGDTILVPPVGRQVSVSGNVKRPAIYELKNETSIKEVLQVAGGLSVDAAVDHIEVERIDANRGRQTIKVPVEPGGDRTAMENALSAFPIIDGDRILVQPIVPWSDRAVYTTGYVVRPGRYPYHDHMLLTDILHSYQDLLPEPSDHGEIVRLAPPDLRPVTIDFNVPEVLAGNTPIELEPFDTIRILGRYAADAPQVTIRGEVLRPGNYPLSEGMTAAGLVRMAGGFKRSALLTEADLASYEIRDGKQVVSLRSTVAIGAAVERADTSADLALKPGDVLTVHQVSGWNDIGGSVKIEGEATYPGTYGLQEGERLSSVLLRAGGFRSTAYPDGAVLLRVEVKALEEKSRAELIRQIESASAAARISPSPSGQDQTSTLQLMIQQQNDVLQRLRNQPSSGRLVIRISSDIHSWQNTDADVEMRPGDELIIPKRPAFVLVSGQVYNASAISYVPGRTAGWYLKRAGGSTDLANRKDIFVIRANGSVVGRRSGGWAGGDVLSTRLDPGDVVVVPQKIIGGSVFWRNVLTTAQLASSLTVAGALAAAL